MSAKYAQHFLINSHAVDRIVEAIRLEAGEPVLEIGPGKGALTERLVSIASGVFAVEIDPRMKEILERKFSDRSNFSLIHSDILKFPFESLPKAGRPYKVIGNLPYNITSPILRRLSLWTGWSEACVMVQKEVGDRIVAGVGEAEYGALTVGVSLTAEAERVFDLTPGSFDPPPKVASTVVRLRRRATPLTDDIETTTRVIQAAFQQRRKMILNSLSHGLSMEKDDVLSMLKRLSIPETIRPERMAVGAFIALAREMKTRS